MRCTVARRAADPVEVEAALASIEGGRGMVLGVDAGVPGLHPLQAVVVSQPSLAIRVFACGVEVEACDAAGESLRRHVPRERPPIESLRGFLAAFRATDAAGDALLVGALRFDAHVLRSGSVSHAPERSGARALGDALGIFFFATAFHRRDAAGAWWHVSLSIDGVPGGCGFHHDRLPLAGEGGEPVDDFASGAYAGAVAGGVQRLAAGSLVSLTLSQSFRRRLGAGDSGVAAFARLRRANPAPVTFFLAEGDGTRLFGASPDLQLVVRGRTVESMPVCGTVPRGHGAVGEAAALAHLLRQDVDAASLAVCTDAMRNDLAPLCVPGTLRLADRLRPMALATVVHTVDRLRGTLRDGADAWDAVVATTAPPMLVGTPRDAALAAIAELEASPRGWYGGLAVQVAADGDALVGTLLRAAAIDRHGVAEVRTGGDLLADSVPAREEEESRLKAVSLWRALGLAVDADLDARLAGGCTAAAPPDVGDPLPAAVALEVAGDPFAAALADALGSLGLAIDADAAVRVHAGTGAADARFDRVASARAVAIGEASGSGGAASSRTVAVGDAAGSDRVATSRTVAIGDAAGADGAASAGTVAIGDAAGPDGAGSAGTVAIGGAAGSDRAGSAGRVAVGGAAGSGGGASTRTVAIGDAAVALLAAAGFTTVAIPPAHGRAVLAHVADSGAAGAARPFQVGRYATRDLDRSGPVAATPTDWSPWLEDGEGHPLALAHAGRRVVCLLFRPESLLCEPPALALLRRAIAFSAAAR